MKETFEKYIKIYGYEKAKKDYPDLYKYYVEIPKKIDRILKKLGDKTK